ncbi:hypothetical protein [Priestia aryabhattai]
MKWYKPAVIPLAIGLLSFVCFIIYSKAAANSSLQMNQSLFISIGIGIGAVPPVSFFVEYQKNKENKKFHREVVCRMSLRSLVC